MRERENLRDIEEKLGGRYIFERVEICDADSIREVLMRHEIDTVVHFAAESHVDRSIHGAGDFIRTNIIGTFTLLELARDYWKDRDGMLFHNVSTDEVFGSLGETGAFSEDTPYDPRSPYSASKASADHLVRALHRSTSRTTVTSRDHVSRYTSPKDNRVWAWTRLTGSDTPCPSVAKVQRARPHGFAKPRSDSAAVTVKSGYQGR
jgi:dTDP-D-glucose 4,6-dehydratase